MSIYDLPTDPPPEEEPKKEKTLPPLPKAGQSASKPAGSIYGLSEESGQPPTESGQPSAEEPAKPVSTKELAAKVRQAAQQPPPDTAAPSNSVYDGPPKDPGKKKRLGRGCILGCLSVLLIPLLVGGIAVGVVAWKWSDWAHGALVAAIEDSGLSDQDKSAVVSEVDRLYEGYRSGEIEAAQLMEVADELGQSPLFSMLMAYAIHEQYLVPCEDMTQDEKDAGYVTLQRVAQGFYKKQITRSDLDAALDYISVEDFNGDRSFHTVAFPDDLRAMLAECQQLADARRIPNVPDPVDVGAQFQQAVQRGLRVEQLAGQ